MSQVLHSLVVSAEPQLQSELEHIMLNNVPGYHVSFTTCPLNGLDDLTRPPDLVFIENQGGLPPEVAREIVQKFPRRTYLVIDAHPEEKRRETFLKTGVDEVMSLEELQSPLGKHMLEKLLALKRLTEAEDRIEESEERFRGIIEHARDVITLLDDEATLIYNSPAFGRLMGYEPWEVLGQPFFGFLHEEDRLRTEVEFRALVAGKDPGGKTMEFRFRHKDGRWRVFEATVSNLLKDALVHAVVLNSRDVTEHRESETELANYRQHLEKLVAQRTEALSAALDNEKMIVEQQKNFISMVSHEFRTPLTIIDGNAQIIQSRGSTLSPEMLAKRSGTIRGAVDRLVRLIETILSAHTLEGGKLAVMRTPTDLAALIRDTCMERLDIAPEHKIKVDIQRDMPKMMLDEKLIRQMMVNLISNAVKYSPKSPLIEVTARQNGQTAVIMIADRGVGIPEEELPKIFTRYFRASTSGGIPGSGLGLSLVKQFVELHDGRIDIQSTVGSGTTVTVLLPVQEAKGTG